MTKIALSVIGGATGASALGSSHIARGKPNQDAVAWQQRRLWTYIAVADGHGSAPHYRSDRGSRMAVDTLIALFRDVTRDGALREPDALARRVPDLAGALVAQWREKVEADVAKEPIPEPAGFARRTVYGSTCLGAAIGPGFAVMMQIGDGDLFVGTGSGDIARVFEADNTEGEQTYSLCLPDAAEHIKIALFTAPNPMCAPDFVFASTDGFSKSLESDETVLAIVRDYRTAIRERGLRTVASELDAWLMKCSQMGSGDDTSVAIFTADIDATDLFVPPRIGSFEGKQDSESLATISPSLQRETLGSPFVVVGALLCGAICGLVAGLWGVPAIEKLVSGTSPAVAPPSTSPAIPALPAPGSPDRPVTPP
ncbi:MAG TPA: PP2C family serine/threonine-protein phosphatase [Beijerinckiaceae bacterium]|nr:PP2C family serine/threonine-protein phosphatase [Beijerinckiaceae bacterium]